MDLRRLCVCYVAYAVTKSMKGPSAAGTLGARFVGKQVARLPAQGNASHNLA